jgi:hypothetical protein
MKKLILFAFGATFISNAQAQIKISPVGGLNVSNYQVSGHYIIQPKVRFGPCVGALVDFPSKNRFSLQSGLLYKLNGYMVGNQQEFIRYRISTLEVPVKWTYSFDKHDRGGFFIGGGIYAAVNVAASVRVHAYRTDMAGNPTTMFDGVEKLKIGGKNNVPRTDGGVGVNFGYRAAKGLLICLQGQYGIVNQGDALTQMHNYNFGIVGGYSFKLKKHKAHSEVPTEAKQ